MKKVSVGFGIITLMSALLFSSECYAEKRQININFVACRTKDDTIRVNKWLSDGDRQAAALEIVNGTCEMLPEGTVVFVEKHGFEWAQVRQQGSNVTVWVLEKFLK